MSLGTQTHTSSHLVTHASAWAADKNDIIYRASEDGFLREQSRSDVWLQYNSTMSLRLPANRYYT